MLAEFASVVDAVNCGVAVQTNLKTENSSLPPERQMEFRIGVNLGDVMVGGEQIYVDGVNVAARLVLTCGNSRNMLNYRHVQESRAFGAHG